MRHSRPGLSQYCPELLFHIHAGGKICKAVCFQPFAQRRIQQYAVGRIAHEDQELLKLILRQFILYIFLQ